VPPSTTKAIFDSYKNSGDTEKFPCPHPKIKIILPLKKKSQYSVGVWLKQYSTCLASVKP
jgi:hypothetical protein